jgi:DNA-binding MarR family transcriptional regulator
MPSRLTFDPIDEATRQWHAHGWSSAAEGMAVVTSVMRVHQLFLARVDSVLAPFELTFARYEVLRLLGFSRHGRLPLGKIGGRLQVHPASVTNAVNRLEERGLAQRIPHESDGRTVLASITAEGRLLCDEATLALNDMVFAKLELSDVDKLALTDLLTEVRFTAGDFARDAGY